VVRSGRGRIEARDRGGGSELGWRSWRRRCACAVAMFYGSEERSGMVVVVQQGEAEVMMCCTWPLTEQFRENNGAAMSFGARPWRRLRPRGRSERGGPGKGGRASERERVREAERELGRMAKRLGGVLDAWSRGEGMVTVCPLRGPPSSS
jgi:hypothetical protein